MLLLNVSIFESNEWTATEIEHEREPNRKDIKCIHVSIYTFLILLVKEMY